MKTPSTKHPPTSKSQLRTALSIDPGRTSVEDTRAHYAHYAAENTVKTATPSINRSSHWGWKCTSSFTSTTNPITPKPTSQLSYMTTSPPCSTTHYSSETVRWHWGHKQRRKTSTYRNHQKWNENEGQRKTINNKFYTEQSADQGTKDFIKGSIKKGKSSCIKARSSFKRVR